ncbi:MAG: hypothetical protein K0S65_6492, partial [Labilithrix sp.]|nr:hypothetical protein [Labilithrix sp.]
MSKLFSGVRSSWLMFARNSLDGAVLLDEERRLLFELLVDLLQLFLLLAQHFLGCAERVGLLLELLVGAFQLVLLLLQLARLLLELVRQRLRLLEELLRPRARTDHVEHDADGLGELLQEDAVDRAERLEARELDDGTHLVLEENRDDDDVERRRLAEPRADLDVVARHLREQDALLLERRLSDEALAQTEAIRDVLALA